MRNPELQSRLSGVASVVAMLIDHRDVKTAVKYINPKLTVRATVVGNPRKNGLRELPISLNIGQPNYAERQFIKACKKAEETFPVWRVQVKRFPKSRMKQSEG